MRCGVLFRREVAERAVQVLGVVLSLESVDDLRSDDVDFSGALASDMVAT